MYNHNIITQPSGETTDFSLVTYADTIQSISPLPYNSENTALSQWRERVKGGSQDISRNKNIVGSYRVGSFDLGH